MSASRTISRVHQNVAQHHYALAMEAWDTYTHCLDDRGLFHPDFVATVKKSLAMYWRHTRIADGLMRLKKVYIPQPIQRAVNRRHFNAEFEKALAQRGFMAKAAAGIVDGEEDEQDSN